MDPMSSGDDVAEGICLVATGRSPLALRRGWTADLPVAPT
jgi:hypothetical protein